ncbi:MAG: antibiotic biosynthesis monooxygenase [Anaerolineae bacterium]|nr:antibiotic biosynthesis monooxygenase [Anaerolineae bacterium]
MTEFTILWHDSSSPFAAPGVRACDLPAGAQHWRGIRDRTAALWLVKNSIDDPTRQELLDRCGFGGDQVRHLQIVREWGGVFGKTLSLANYVLREMQPDSLDSFLPLLDRQMSQVVTRPGCLGAALASEKAAPHHLLGITYWEAEQSFAQYMGWFSKQYWKYTVNPLTVNVPLRQLMRRTGASG